MTEKEESFEIPSPSAPHVMSAREHLFNISIRLERMEERERSYGESLKNILSSIKETQEDVKKINSEIHDEMEEKYVRKNDFDPVKRLVFGFVGAALFAFGGLLMSVFTDTNHGWLNPRMITPSHQIQIEQKEVEIKERVSP